ncbi:MAG: hypothetical protein JWN41_814, partial [Thermoleophilia bacterium]|nr:hypothetical protein [Thermoleophilia bacterium]
PDSVRQPSRRRPSDALIHVAVLHTEITEHVGRGTIGIAQHRKQQVIGADVLVAKAKRFLARLPHHMPCSFGEIHAAIVPVVEMTETWRQSDRPGDASAQSPNRHEIR